MIIWLLAVVLFGCLGFAGWAFGAVRAAFTFAGLFIALLAAKLFGHALVPALGHVGIKNPMVAWLLAPFLVFVAALTVVKIFGFVANTKVQHYFKYKAGDLRAGLWNRLNPRLGLCLGLANASVYLVLISVVIYPFSYMTTQLASGEGVSWMVKLLNSAGNGLQASGMDRVAGAIDPMPEDYYEAVDLAGLLYHNPLYEARLSLYPGFFTMGQKPEFQALGDKSFTELVQGEPPISQIWNDPKVQAIVTNPDLLREIWAVVTPNFADLRQFLATGLSQKFDDKILGRWSFNMNGALTEVRAAKPNMSSHEMLATRVAMILMFAKTTLLATPENTLYVKSLGKVRYVPANPNNPGMMTPPGRGMRGGGRGGPPPGGAPGMAPRPGGQPGAAPGMTPTVEMQDLTGNWKSDGADFRLMFPGQSYEAVVDGDKLTLTGGPFPMVFDRDY